jgi:hypothetical protein
VKHPPKKFFKKFFKKIKIKNKKSQMNQKKFKNILFLFFWGARPGSASGCLKKATQIPKAGHPI